MFDGDCTSPSVALVRRSASISRREPQAPQGRDDTERFTADLIELARKYGRYGYRTLAVVLHAMWKTQTPFWWAAAVI
jgi:hypothetical protein